MNLLKNRFSSLALPRLPPQLLITLIEAGNQLHPPPHAFDVIQLAFGLPLCIFTPSPPCIQFMLCAFRVILVPRLEDHLLWPSFHWRSCTPDTPSDVLPALKAPSILLMRPPALAQQCSNHKSDLNSDRKSCLTAEAAPQRERCGV